MRGMPLNRKGKITIFLMLTLILSLLVGWGTIVKANSGKNKPTIALIPAQPLSSSFKPKQSFAASDLNHSIQNKKELSREQAVNQKAQQQLEKDHKHKVIYLTFDDGPSLEADQLLDVLDHYNAKATFFMLGPNMESRKHVVKRMVKEDFGVGLHGITHDAHKIYSSKAAPLKEMTQDQKILKEIAGVQSELVRLPYGSIPYLTVDMRSLLNKNGFKTWDWNIDSQDWELKDQRFVQNVIQDIQNLEKTGMAPVILMHDKATTVHYLPQLLDYLNKHGYQTKKLTNAMPPLTFQCEGRCHSMH
ncbi:polysaccharide deacetylase family protein [Pullulanibacillus pueri]|nr:polysaccharide deacetylase family protein [Pullulanibacillus pueri]